MSAGKRIGRFASRRACKLPHRAAGHAVEFYWAETMEPRRLLASAGMNGTTLEVLGDDTGDTSTINDVLVVLLVTGTPDTFFVTEGPNTIFQTTSTVDFVFANGRSGDDTITMDGSMGSRPATILAGAVLTSSTAVWETIR